MEIALFIGSVAVMVGATCLTLWYILKKGKVHFDGPDE